MTNDTISRRVAIDTICEHGTDLERRGITVLSVAYHKQATVDLLEKLPSAERLGRWIDDETGYICSICFHGSPNGAKWDYCPNCGARMMDEVKE